MRCDAIAIEELVLRVPGVKRDDAPKLVEDALRRVQQELRGADRVGHVHLADLKVKVAVGADRDQIVDAIVQALTGALR